MRIFVNIWILVFFLNGQAGFASDIGYTIHPVLSESNAYLQVDLKLKADSDGNTALIYFNEAWGEVNLYDCLESIQVLNTSARLKIVPEQNKIYIKSEPSELLHIQYVIKQDFKGNPEKAHYFRPIVNASYFHLFGHRLFIIPEYLYTSEAVHEIDIDWEDAPTTVHHTFESKLKGTYRVTRNELLESILVGGDFRRTTLAMNGIKLNVLTRGDWAHFEDEELAEKLESIVQIQQNFWEDYSDSIYTVTLLPLYSSGSNYIGGTGLSRGFASYCSNTDASRLENLTALYYHEIMHHWIGGKMRNKSLTEELWFSEGFTEYFSHLLMVENNEMTEKDFRKLTKNIYKDLKKSAYSEVPNSEIGLQRLSQESAIEKVPYHRGFLYAMYLEKRFRKGFQGSVTLKSVLHKMLLESDRQLFSNDYFKEVLGQYFSEDEIRQFENYIIDGQMIEKELIF
ncbi:M1 family aminopeptidase [Portibacter marinus]|uniref:M1 family aminopeptidase n=1 Tax=Portibacter marinus TaxID=2898660 RepID=UPI001F25D99D|nr:M1 family aminopeptidase [Portibacter marinus]